MTTKSFVKTLSSARADEMAMLDDMAIPDEMVMPNEMVTDDTWTSDSGLSAPPIEQLMAPTQALTSGFDIDASGEIEQPAPKQDQPAGLSPLASTQSRQGFRIGDFGLMIRYEDASELVEMSVIHRLPNAPDWFCGIANLHGKLTPVFDLARYIGIDPDSEAKRMLLVISRGSDATGVLIDGLPVRLRRIDDECTEANALPKRLMPHIRGAFLLGEQLWFDLDTHSLLGAIEQSLGQPQ